MTKLNQESGRSMVEMLGVLAIIGVLSIGGIAGYTMAMNRYKANEILNAASVANVMAMSQDQGNGTYGSAVTYDSLMGGTNKFGGIEGAKMTVTSANNVQVSEGVDSGVCDALKNIAGGKATCTGNGSATINFAS